MIKVAIVDPVGTIAGMHHYDVGLAMGLSKNNIKPVIYSTFTNDDISSKSIKTFKSGKKFLILDVLSFFFSGLYTFLILKFQKVDWVILHVFSYTSKDFFPFVLAKIFGVKIVSIAHDLEGFEEKDNNYIKNKIYSWSSSVAIHNSFSINEFNRIFDSKYKDKVFQIPHGNYIPFISKNNINYKFDFLDNLDNSKKYILFFGQIKPTKGLDVLLKSLKFIDPNIHLIIAGRSRYDDFNQYLEIINSVNIRSRVHMLIRYISDKERELLFHYSDAIIVPYSKIYQSGVLILSMSYGIPVIASDLPPNKEIIDNGRTGILFETEDEIDLANKITSLFENKSLLRKISQASFDYVNTKHSWCQVGAYFFNNLSQ